MFWPSSFEIWQYSPSGRIWFVVSLFFGLLVGYLRRARPWRTPLTASLAGLLISALATHAAAIVTLMRDPQRGLGRIPLPEPWAGCAALLGVVLAVLAPCFASLLCLRALSAASRHHPISRVTAVVITVYAVYISPWALNVLLD